MFDTELTSQQAADRIGVSRPFLVQSLAPWRMIGNRRRYLIADVDTFAATLAVTTEPSSDVV